MKPFSSATAGNLEAVGVDLSPAAIRMVRVRRNEDSSVTFLGCKAVDVNSEVEFGSPAFISLLRDVLGNFCGSGKQVKIWAALPGDGARVHRLIVPRMNGDRLGNAIHFALKREEPFVDEETVVDFELNEPETATDKDARLSATGFLAPRAEVNKLARIFSNAGFPLSGLALPLFALRSLLCSKWMTAPAGPVVLAYFGFRSLQLSIIDKGSSAVTRTIPVGLQSLAETLSQDLFPRPNEEQAQQLVQGRLLRSDGSFSSWEEGEVVRVLRPALERIARQIERTLDYYQSTHEGPAPERVYVAGTIAGNRHLTEFIGKEMGIDLTVMDPLAGRIETGSVSFATAAGLALSGTMPTPNLLYTYKERQREQRVRRTNRVILAVFLVLVMGCGAFYTWQQKQIQDLRDERDRIAQSPQLIGPRLDETALLGMVSQLRERAANQREALRRYESSALVAELSRITPEHVRLLNLTARLAPASAAGSPRESGRRLRIEGIVAGDRRALDSLLTVYTTQLSRSLLFRRVELESTSPREAGNNSELFFVLGIDLHSLQAEASR